MDQYGCECNRRDIQRMELIVMHKLEFDLNRPTAQDFLKSVSILDESQHYHPILLLSYSFTPCRCLADWLPYRILSQWKNTFTILLSVSDSLCVIVLSCTTELVKQVHTMI